MEALLVVVAWLAGGAILSAAVLGLVGIPVMHKPYSFSEKDEINFNFCMCMVMGSLLWPVMLAVALAFFPARSAYRWASKRP